MIILIDTREQKEIKFKENCRWLKLEVGDYSTNILLNKFHIERKSAADLYGSIVQNHMRFRRMLLRAVEHGIQLVVFVECTQRIFENKLWPRAKERKCTSSTLKKIIATMKRHYDLEFVWCSSRLQMRKLMLKRFRKEERKTKK
jgi:ERCC4-type nuclease